MSEIINKIEEDFFFSYADIIEINPNVGHQYDNGIVSIGWSGTQEKSSKTEMLLHEMCHLIEASPRNVFAKTNWGFKQTHKGWFDGEWLKKAVTNECTVMNMTYHLLEHYQVGEWLLDYSSYADLMTNSFENSLRSFCSDEDSYLDLEDWLGEPIHHYFYSEIMESLESRNYNFSEIKNLWDKKLASLREYLK